MLLPDSNEKQKAKKYGVAATKTPMLREKDVIAVLLNMHSIGETCVPPTHQLEDDETCTGAGDLPDRAAHKPPE